MVDSEAFMRTFFGKGNGLVWGQMPPDFTSWLDPWLQRVRRRQFPVLLPRLTAQKQMVWYAVSETSAASDELRELITAFVGPSYSRFSGQFIQLNEEDPVELAIVASLGRAVYTFTVPNREDASTIRVGLDRMRVLLESRPADPRSITRPLGRILRDFDLAIVAGDPDLTDQLIGELRSNGYLSAANLAFLELARLGAIENWEGILGHPNLARVIEMRRPTRATLAVVEAIYRTHLLSHELEQDAHGALLTFEREVLPRYRPVIDSLPLLGPFATRLHLLYALSKPPGATLAGLEWLDAVEPAADVYSQHLVGMVRDRMKTSRQPPDLQGIDEVRQLVANGELHAAAAILRSLPASPLSAALLVHCAYEVNTLELAKEASLSVEQLSADALEELPDTRQFRSMLAAIRETVRSVDGPTKVPGSWAEWFELILEEACQPYATRWAQAGAEEWASSEFEDPRAIDMVVARLGEGSDAVVSVQREALPFLLRALDAAPADSRQRVYTRMLETLLYRGAHTQAELQIVLDVLEAVIVKFGSREYTTAIGDLADIWQEVQSPKTLSWAMELLDLLAIQPCRDQQARSNLAIAVMATGRAFLRRLNPSVRLTVNELALELGVPSEALLPAPDDPEDEPDPLVKLRGVRLALYTLTEDAAVRARNRLGEWTGRGIDVLTDKVCSDALRIAAREADLFVMVTRSAKHAATDCIRRSRPEGKPLIVSSGKGSSSVIYAVRQFLSDP